jgi:cytochrome c oxidase subunit 3
MSTTMRPSTLEPTAEEFPEAITLPESVEVTEDVEIPAADVPHDDHVAHHFDSAEHQFEAAKLGMWLFLATEFLLFGGLFCLYAVYRHAHPDLFAYGARFLNTNLGMLNTTVLILSSMTMAWAVRCAQLNQRRRLMLCLVLTILGGAGFMTVKYFEYSHKINENLVWGVGFYEQTTHERLAMQRAARLAKSKPAAAPRKGDADKGKALWMGTCRTCHDVDGRGIKGQGKDIRGSQFIASKTDAQMVEFVKGGRMPSDPLNTTGIQMPPRGGNPMLKDSDLQDIIAYVRTFKAAEGPAATGSAAVAPETEFYIPKSTIPDALAGPAGMAAHWDAPPAEPDRSEPRDPRRDPARPPNPHLFFGLYYLMTGLHGLHVLIGMIAITWLLVRAWLGHFTPRYFTPVDLVGLYWHVVDIIWIFLFPLLYLIR